MSAWLLKVSSRFFQAGKSNLRLILRPAHLTKRKLALHLVQREERANLGVPASIHVERATVPAQLTQTCALEDCMQFRPLHDRIVLKRIEADSKTTGGIIIPDTAQEKPSQGEVIAVGPGGRDEAGKLTPIDLKVGDVVLFGKWSGTEVKIDGQDLLIMKESDIMGVLEGFTASKKKAA